MVMRKPGNRRPSMARWKETRKAKKFDFQVGQLISHSVGGFLAACMSLTIVVVLQ